MISCFDVSNYPIDKWIDIREKQEEHANKLTKKCYKAVILNSADTWIYEDDIVLVLRNLY